MKQLQCSFSYRIPIFSKCLLCGSGTVHLYFYRQTNFDAKKCIKNCTSSVQSQLAFFHSPEHEVHYTVFSTSVCPSVVNMYFLLPFGICFFCDMFSRQEVLSAWQLGSYLWSIVDCSKNLQQHSLWGISL